MVMPTMQAFAMPSFGLNPLQQLQSMNGKLSPMQQRAPSNGAPAPMNMSNMGRVGLGAPQRLPGQVAPMTQAVQGTNLPRAPMGVMSGLGQTITPQSMGIANNNAMPQGQANAGTITTGNYWPQQLAREQSTGTSVSGGGTMGNMLNNMLKNGSMGGLMSIGR